MMNAAQRSASTLASTETHAQLGNQWRILRRAATLVAVLGSPAVFVWLHNRQGYSIGWSIAMTAGAVIVARGAMDLAFRRFIPWPSLFGAHDARLAEEDVLNRRRAWFWKSFFRWSIFVGAIVAIMWELNAWSFLRNLVPLLLILPFYFVLNFLILLGPMMWMGISQIHGYEPGDATWGVKLDDVRGQAEAKEEVRRIVDLWQSGEIFEQAGGQRERGLLFLGAPGTGKTMLAKAIATGFNSPIVTIPGSGFAQTFIGIDALMVRYLARKAKRLASKWGGQCIVFIDEIDAVGTRRRQLEGQSMTPLESPTYFGRFGALNASGDMIVESAAWRDHLFVQRAEESGSPYPPWMKRIGNILNQFPGGMMGGMGGGQLALNQLLVTMDGIDNPPFLRRMLTNKINTIMDASYFVPRRIGKVKLRLPHVRPTGNQIYFIGATNVPLEVLDPALTRPGRMGRHVQFRTPTKDDRKDIFDLYLGRVAHEPELDHPQRRDEIARITNGYAQPLDSTVLTPTGWSRMGDLEPGDVVVGSSGRPTSVQAVHPRGEMDVFRVEFNDGTSTECTGDHLWTVEALDPRMRPRTFTTEQLRRRNLRWSACGSAFYLPKLGAVEYAESSELPLDPYLVGVLIGDGGLTSTTPDICTADAEILAAVTELVPAGVEARRHRPMNWWLSSGRRGGARGRVNPLTARVVELGLWGSSAYDKFVPAAYKLASSPDRLALLQGLMDTDGTVDYRRGTGPEFSSHSRRLAEDVAAIARSLGGTARVASKGDGWRVGLDLPDGLVPFRLARKAQVYRSSRKPFRKRITAIVPAGRKPVQCITVAAENGLYLTNDFIVTHNSPAMIEQITSMALSNAHHEGKLAFEWQDLVDAMTTIEAGTAVGVRYVESETRAVALHEAGHATAAHMYRPNLESSRLSIRMRGSSLGHHQAFEKEERFSQWHHEAMGNLVHTLGAMAAEIAFYGENSSGVGGDLGYATQSAAMMVGAAGMGPDHLDVSNVRMADESEEQARERIMRRFEKIGLTLMNRTRGSADFHNDPVAAILRDPFKRAQAAQMMGQAFVTAHNFIEHNREGVEKVAEAVIEKQELFGDDLNRLLDSVKLEKPEIDLAKEETWPKL